MLSKVCSVLKSRAARGTRVAHAEGGIVRGDWLEDEGTPRETSRVLQDLLCPLVVVVDAASLVWHH